MKNLHISLFVVIAFLFSCKNNSQNDNKNVVIEVASPTDFKTRIDNKSVQLIDVRTPDEFTAGHLKNSKNINFYDDDFMTQMETLDKTQPVYVYCKSGGRSGKASTKLKEAGFTKVYDLDGGFLAWSKKSFETEK